jgi:tRNA-dihydrouridine synthase
MATGEHLAPATIQDRVDTCLVHLNKSIEWKGEHVGIVEMRRHYSNYFKGLDHFKETRMTLVTSNNLEEIIMTLNNISGRYAEVL